MAYRKTKITSPDYTFIPSGLSVGAQVIIKGRVSDTEERFHINLQNDKPEGSDVAFHFNPRNEVKTVVRNTFVKKWQIEEVDTPSFPFANGSKFTVSIHVTSDSYLVLVNGQQFIQYKHRLPFKDVRYLKLSEGAEYYEAIIQNGSRTSYHGEFPGGLKIGEALRVRGFVNDDAKRFEINFKSDIKGDVVCLHFNPRQNENLVVLNSKDVSWYMEHNEERSQGWFPFERSKYFDVLFIASNDHFNIYVNGQFFKSFKFRISLEKIKFLQILGDVTVKDVELTEPLPKDYIKKTPSGLQDGDFIVIKGFFYPEKQRFHFNFITDTSGDRNVAFHFNPRREENEVVLNTRKNGEWEKEERHPFPDLFSKIVPFEVGVLVTTEKFKTYLNGRHFADFNVRYDIKLIRGVNFAEDGNIYEIKHIPKVEKPSVNRLPGKLEPGSWITVIGTPKKKCDKFAINLQCGDSPDYKCVVPFHFNPRFPEKETVRNTFNNGTWGLEEKTSEEFPFKPEDRFEVNIVRLAKTFRVFVNYKFYTDYVHRIDPSNVTHLMLTGDCNFLEPEFF